MRFFQTIEGFQCGVFVVLFPILQTQLGAICQQFTEGSKYQPGGNKGIGFPFPPLPEQQVIAAYLDAKTVQIDRRIDLLTQKAEKYRQLRQSLINAGRHARSRRVRANEG